MSARPLLPLLLLVAACDPHLKVPGSWDGPIDPSLLPADRRGTIRPAMATAGGLPAPYFAFAAGDDAVGAPAAAYVFDPAAAAARCTPPAGYAYDARRDAYRLDQQGPLFAALPDGASPPLWARVPVTSNGEACQSVIDAAGVGARGDVLVGAPDGVLLAWAVVDPGADVAAPLGLGWWARRLVAYLDGGVAPTTADGAHVVAERLYVPTATPDGPGARGSGFDVLEARRGEPGYSPLCRVWSFDPADPQHPPTSAADIDAAGARDTGAFVWCLQVAE